MNQVKKNDHPFKVLSDLESKILEAYNLNFELNDQLVPLSLIVAGSSAPYNGY